MYVYARMYVCIYMCVYIYVYIYIYMTVSICLSLSVYLSIVYVACRYLAIYLSIHMYTGRTRLSYGPLRHDDGMLTPTGYTPPSNTAADTAHSAHSTDTDTEYTDAQQRTQPRRRRRVEQIRISINVSVSNVSRLSSFFPLTALCLCGGSRFGLSLRTEEEGGGGGAHMPVPVLVERLDAEMRRYMCGGASVGDES